MRLRRRWSRCWRTCCWTRTDGGEWLRLRRGLRDLERCSGSRRWGSGWEGVPPPPVSDFSSIFVLLALRAGCGCKILIPEILGGKYLESIVCDRNKYLG